MEDCIKDFFQYLYQIKHTFTKITAQIGKLFFGTSGIFQLEGKVNQV